MVNLLEKDLQRRDGDKLLDELIKDEEFKEMLMKKIKEISE